MAKQFGVAVRNGILDSIETTIGASPLLRILSGAVPADCATVQSGTLLATLTLPADWLNAAAAGVKTLLGSWTVAAAAAGTAGYYRILNSAGTVAHEQGTVTATGGGGDMTLDNVVIAAAQVITITAYTLNAGNA